MLSAVPTLQVRHVFAGTAARTMAQALIHPLDTVKTRLQVLVSVCSSRHAGSSPSSASRCKYTKGLGSRADIGQLERHLLRVKVRTPEGLLKTWRKATRQYPFDFHVGPHRIVHARNVLVSGAARCSPGIMSGHTLTASQQTV